MRIAVLARLGCILLTAGAASATTPALDWYIDQAGTPREIRLIGNYTADDDQMIGADPLTFQAGYGWSYFQIPTTPARFYALYDPQGGVVAAAFLVYSDGDPVCGEALGVIGVDTGTGAFLTRKTAEKLDRFGQELAARGQDLYNDHFSAVDQMGDADFARFLSLPDGTSFPAFSTGWGDGGYMTSRLVDASGETVAIYADFLGSEVRRDWIDPPACGSS